MKLLINEVDKNTIEVDIDGSKHTLPNILRKELWNDSTVTFSAYNKEHPYVGNPVLIVKAKDPKKSLKEAIKRTKKIFEDMEKEISKQIKD
jgi:DNA-directed RNA polymerase subunit L